MQELYCKLVDYDSNLKIMEKFIDTYFSKLKDLSFQVQNSSSLPVLFRFADNSTSRNIPCSFYRIALHHSLNKNPKITRKNPVSSQEFSTSLFSYALSKKNTNFLIELLKLELEFKEELQEEEHRDILFKLTEFSNSSNFSEFLNLLSDQLKGNAEVLNHKKGGHKVITHLIKKVYTENIKDKYFEENKSKRSKLCSSNDEMKKVILSLKSAGVDMNSVYHKEKEYQ